MDCMFISQNSDSLGEYFKYSLYIKKLKLTKAYLLKKKTLVAFVVVFKSAFVVGVVAI